MGGGIVCFMQFIIFLLIDYNIYCGLKINTNFVRLTAYENMDISLENIKSGDKKAFKDFFLTSYKDMLRYASCFLSDYIMVEDIVQECFVNLWENRDNLDINKSLVGYIRQSIKNKCLNYNRHNAVKLKFAKENAIDVEDYVYSIDEQTAENIKRQIEKVPETSRKVLELNVIYGLKYAEIAEDMGISVNTVKYHIKIAYKILRESIKTRAELIYFLLLFKKC